MKPEITELNRTAGGLAHVLADNLSLTEHQRSEIASALVDFASDWLTKVRRQLAEARGAAPQADRAVVCVWCGKAITHYRAGDDVKAAWDKARQHDVSCQSNPLVTSPDATRGRAAQEDTEALVMAQLNAHAWTQGVRPAIDATNADEFVSQLMAAVRAEARGPAPRDPVRHTAEVTISDAARSSDPARDLAYPPPFPVLDWTVFPPCDGCKTATHCAHHKRCLAECVPADLVPSCSECGKSATHALIQYHDNGCSIGRGKVVYHEDFYDVE